MARTAGNRERSRDGHPAGLGALTHCPRCGGKLILTVNEDAPGDFLCEQCGQYWHVEMGYVHRVLPAVHSDDAPRGRRVSR